MLLIYIYIWTFLLHERVLKKLNICVRYAAGCSWRGWGWCLASLFEHLCIWTFKHWNIWTFLHLNIQTLKNLNICAGPRRGWRSRCLASLFPDSEARSLEARPSKPPWQARVVPWHATKPHLKLFLMKKNWALWSENKCCVKKKKKKNCEWGGK